MPAGRAIEIFRWLIAPERNEVEVSEIEVSPATRAVAVLVTTAVSLPLHALTSNATSGLQITIVQCSAVYTNVVHAVAVKLQL